LAPKAEEDSFLPGKVTRIGVISDTHHHHLEELPPALKEMLASVDLILHMGDFVCMELLEELRRKNNFHGIAGNHDPHSIKAILPRTDLIEVNGKRLGLLHGYWFPFFCEHRSLARFAREKVDAIIYGHTHVIRNEVSHNILFFNPGTASAMWPAPWKTFGILTVGDKIKGEIVELARKQKGSLEKVFDRFITRDKIVELSCGSMRNPDYAAPVPVCAAGAHLLERKQG
jgi:putative phosphoesterase